jgi:pyruvate,water dikinase
MFTKKFQQIKKEDVGEAGGKGASLGEMAGAGMKVPSGFVVLASAFDRFLEEVDLKVEIDSIISKVNHEDVNSVAGASIKIQDLIDGAVLPEDIAKEVKNEFKKLGAKYVAVRSSATAEDSSIASWAGELETYLNIEENELLQSVKKCWASLFTPRAIFYRFEKGLQDTQVSVAVVVQKMVQSEVSGICFTVHPVTEDKNQMVIEAGYGLGEAIVGGLITPDTYIIDKRDFSLLDKNISEQTKMIVKNENNETLEVEVLESKQSEQKMGDTVIIELAKICVDIEKHYGKPQDIEWAYEGDELYITQSRPITTLSVEGDSQSEGKELYKNPIDKYLYEMGDQDIWAVLPNVSLLFYFSKWNKSDYVKAHFDSRVPFLVAGVFREGESFAYPTNNTGASCAIEFFKKYLSEKKTLEKIKNKINDYINKVDELYEKWSFEIIDKLDFKNKIDLLNNVLDLICWGV